MTIDDQIKDEKLQYDINRASVTTSSLEVIHKGCPHKFWNFRDPLPPFQTCPHLVDHPSPHSTCLCGHQAGII